MPSVILVKRNGEYEHAYYYHSDMRRSFDILEFFASNANIDLFATNFSDRFGQPLYTGLRAINFAYNSVYCERVYVTDLDSGVFEIYFGGTKKEPDKTEKFMDRPMTTHNAEKILPVHLACSWPLDKLPSKDEYDKTLLAQVRIERLLMPSKKQIKPNTGIDIVRIMQEISHDWRIRI